MGKHECWVIINSDTGCVVAFEKQYCAYMDEGSAWEVCLKARKTNPERNFTVKRTELSLPWYRQ